MPTLSSRQLFLALFLVCAGLLAYALYLEHFQNLEPCPLCMTQRIFFVLCGLFGLIAALHHPAQTGTRVYAGLIGASAAGGAAIAGRHLWLQSLPPGEAPACGPSLGYMFDTFPLGEAIELLLKGDGNCAEVSWSFLGITMPGWALVWFVAIILLAFVLLFRRSSSAR